MKNQITGFLAIVFFPTQAIEILRYSVIVFLR